MTMPTHKISQKFDTNFIKFLSINIWFAFFWYNQIDNQMLILNVVTCFLWILHFLNNFYLHIFLTILRKTCLLFGHSIGKFVLCIVLTSVPVINGFVYENVLFSCLFLFVSNCYMIGLCLHACASRLIYETDLLH